MAGNKNRRHKKQSGFSFSTLMDESCDHVTLESFQSCRSGRCRKETNGVPGSKSVTEFLSCLVPWGPYPEEWEYQSSTVKNIRLYLNRHNPESMPHRHVTQTPTPLWRETRSLVRAAASRWGPNREPGLEETALGDSRRQVSHFVLSDLSRVFFSIPLLNATNESCRAVPR